MYRQKMKIKQKTTLQTVLLTRVLLTSFSLLLFIFLFWYFFNTPFESKGANNGDYRTKSSGTWTNMACWETYNGTSWIAATSTPTSANGEITIRSGHTIDIISNLTTDQLKVESGATLNLNAGTLTCAKSGIIKDFLMSGNFNVSSSCTVNTGTDIEVLQGGVMTLLNTGALTLIGGGGIKVFGRFIQRGGILPTSSSSFTITNTGVYEHAMDGGTIPLSPWPIGSQCLLSGLVNTAPANMTQVFKDLSWDCPNMNFIYDYGGLLTNVKNNLNIYNTGTGAIFFDRQGNNTSMLIEGSLNVFGGNVFICENGSANVNVMGNLNVSGGTFNFNAKFATAYGNLSAVVYVWGNVNVDNGTLVMSNCTANNQTKGIGELYIEGNLNVSNNGVITENSINSRGKIFMVMPGNIKQFTSNNQITRNIDMIINPDVRVNMGNNVFTGSGDFTLSATAGIYLGSALGISSTGPTGNVQNTGARNFHTNADYTYDGTYNQITGNGLPATVRNLTLNNGNLLTMTLSCSVASILHLQSGRIVTNSNEIISSNSNTSSITGYSNMNYVIGNLRRTTSNNDTYIFPLGTLMYYEPASIKLNGVSGFVNILGKFTNINPIEPGLPLVGIMVNGYSINDALNYGYWEFTPNSPMTGGNYNITLSEKGYTNASIDAATYCVIKRANNLSSWLSLGSHSNSTQSQIAGVATAVRSGLTSFSDFAIGRSRTALPIELLYFTAKPLNKRVELKWSTAREIDNDYFTVERSIDNISFETILKVDGAGNSASILTYAAYDEQPLSGTSYYRLRQTDFSGLTTLSPVQTCFMNFDSPDNSEITIQHIAPTLFTSGFDIQYVIPTEDKQPISLRIYNMSGQLLIEEKIVGNKGQNIYSFKRGDELPSGMFFVVLEKNGVKSTMRTIKNN